MLNGNTECVIRIEAEGSERGIKMANTKYNIDDTVLAVAFDLRVPERKSIQRCIISMITITRKGIRYRMKTEAGGQQELWENDIIGMFDDKENEWSE